MMMNSHHRDMKIPLVISTNNQEQHEGENEDGPSWDGVEEHLWSEAHLSVRTGVLEHYDHFASMDPENPYCAFLMSRVLPCFWLFQWWIMEAQQSEEEGISNHREDDDNDDDEYHEDDDSSRFRRWYHHGFSLLHSNRPFLILTSVSLILLVLGYMLLWTRYRHPGSNRFAAFLQKKQCRMQVGGVGAIGLSNTAILLIARHIPTCFLGISNILLVIFHQKVAALVVLVSGMLFMGIVTLGWGHTLDQSHLVNYCYHTPPASAFHFHPESAAGVSFSPTPGEFRNWALPPPGESHVDDDILL
jgi:hypothetical protein